MATRKIVVVGGSAGSLGPLRQLVSRLPADLPASLVVSTHLPTGATSHLPQILARTSKLSVLSGHDRMELNEGTIYVAKPNHHILVERDHLHLSHGPKENHVRPAINPLFRSAAHAYGPDTIGVLLSGALDDGVAGLWEIKRRGGIALVQAPEDAVFADMPSNALDNVDIDYSAPASQLADRIAELVSRTSGAALRDNHRRSVPVKITCPECRGPMEQVTEGALVEFRCRVNHTYAPESMLDAHAETEERTLWAAVVALEEGADLIDKLYSYTSSHLREQVSEQAAQKRATARIVRQALERLNSTEREPQKTRVQAQQRDMSGI